MRLEPVAELATWDLRVKMANREPRVNPVMLDHLDRSELRDRREIRDHLVHLDLRVILVSRVQPDTPDSQVRLVVLVRLVKQESRGQLVSREHKDSLDPLDHRASLVTTDPPVHKVSLEPLETREPAV